MDNLIKITKQSDTYTVGVNSLFGESRLMSESSEQSERIRITRYSVVGPFRVLSFEEYLSKYSSLTELINCPGYTLLKDIEFDNAELIEGDIYLSYSNLGLYGSGRTLREVKKECCRMLIGLYEAFATDDDNLSKDAKEFGKRLKGYLIKTGVE